MVRSIIFGIFLTLIASHQKSFIDSAPTTSDTSTKAKMNLDDTDVEELENLKNSLKEKTDLLTSSGFYSEGEHPHTTDNEKAKHTGKIVSALYQQLNTNSGKFVENSETTTVRDENQEMKGMEESKIFRVFRHDNSPLDMAEYVFWTGDEKSVSLAVEEFLRRGLMDKMEAVLYLQEIKLNLDYLKRHYSRFDVKNYLENKKENNKKYDQTENRNNKEENIKNQLGQLRKLQEVYKKRNVEKSRVPLSRKYQQKDTNAKNGVDDTEDYDELMERLRLADFLYTEYSLEEIIYQLAKIMFDQSLNDDNVEAQQALTKFMNFLEEEAEKGHISKTLEKKVLDVLIASLTDTVNEHPELFNSKLTDESKENGQKFIKELLELSPDDKAILREILNPLNDKTVKTVPLNEEKKNSHLPFGFMGK